MCKNFQTSYSLLERAINLDDQEAWNHLLDQYKAFVYFLLHKLNIHEKNADDLAQIVMIDLAQKINTYDRSKGRFRNWFGTLIRNRALESYRKASAENRKIDNYTASLSYFADHSPNEIDHTIEKEWKDYITMQAFEKLESSFHPKTIQSFKMELQGMSATEISKELDISINTVYSYKRRVKKSLMLEVRALIQDLEGSGHAS